MYKFNFLLSVYSTSIRMNLKRFSEFHIHYVRTKLYKLHRRMLRVENVLYILISPNDLMKKNNLIWQNYLMFFFWNITFVLNCDRRKIIWFLLLRRKSYREILSTINFYYKFPHVMFHDINYTTSFRYSLR